MVRQLNEAQQAAREEEGRRRSALIKGKKKLKATLSANLSAVGSLFQMWDLNGNGTIDRDEFVQAVNALSVSEVPHEVAGMLFREFDHSGDGEISYHEYLRYALRDGLAKSSTKVMDLFQAIDKDGSGEVDKDEVSSLRITACSLQLAACTPHPHTTLLLSVPTRPRHARLRHSLRGRRRSLRRDGRRPFGAYRFRRVTQAGACSHLHAQRGLYRWPHLVSTSYPPRGGSLL